jgi:hypothetical protein
LEKNLGEGSNEEICKKLSKSYRVASQYSNFLEEYSVAVQEIEKALDLGNDFLNFYQACICYLKVQDYPKASVFLEKVTLSKEFSYEMYQTFIFRSFD